jgi:prepilin-type N-terminal cleavage/methylation domain-containing protein
MKHPRAIIRNRHHRGFTIIECVVVTAILVISAAIAAPMYQILQSDRLSTLSREVISQLRVAQIAAVKEDRFTRFKTDPGYPNQYRIEMSADNTTWPALTAKVAGTAGTLPRVVTDWVNVTSQYADISIASPNTVPFDFRGAIANNLGDMGIGLSGPTGTKTITVNHSGGILVQ